MIISDLRRIAALALVCSAATFVSMAANADTDEQRAVALFDKGRKLARDGRCAEAVPVLLESIGYAEGVGPLLNLGNCYETLGKIASAHRYFLKAQGLAAARDDSKRRDEAAQRAKAIEKDVSMLTIHVPAWMRSSSTTVRVDGEVVPKDQWEKPMPVDPGPHEIDVVAPPNPKQTESVTVHGKGARTEWTATTRAPATPSPAASRAPAAAIAPVPEPTTDEGNHDGSRVYGLPPEGSSTQRTLGLVTGGVGLAGLALGGIFGAMSLSAHSSVVARCPTYPTCPSSDRAGLDAENQNASSYGTVATIGVIAGVVLVAAGAVLFFTAPSPSRAAH
jgi:hypothetical protein